jgi:hypothetical protein
MCGIEWKIIGEADSAVQLPQPHLLRLTRWSFVAQPGILRPIITSLASICSDSIYYYHSVPKNGSCYAETRQVSHSSRNHHAVSKEQINSTLHGCFKPSKHIGTETKQWMLSLICQGKVN